MRVLVRTRKVADDPRGQHDVEVVNAETGEQLRGVTSLCFKASSTRTTLNIELCDFDVEIDDQEAQLSLFVPEPPWMPPKANTQLRWMRRLVIAR